MNASNGPYAYCTLITRASYLAGVIILADSLKEQGSLYPLIVLYPPTLAQDAVLALQLEAPRTNLILHETEPLLPRGEIQVQLIAARFADTWTKLRVFGLHETYPQFKKICYLDADMLVLHSPDSLFTDHLLPGPDWIGANHACVCNLDNDPWAHAEWTKENCAYTPLSHPLALMHPTPVTASARPTYHLLNSGMFMFIPSPKVWSDMMEFFHTSPLLADFKFPDQDFLAEFFRDRWMSLGWQFNALKTMRYWHPNMWRDDEVVVLHYIVDKPWAAKVKEDGVAGYLGRDGVTHRWWWEAYERWKIGLLVSAKSAGADVSEVVKLVEAHIDGGHGARSQDMQDIGAKVQALAGGQKSGTT